jgi:serine-type D-Ala-D-Ala carboxypeptidase (penicillin-binding protein 5/6)
MASATKIMAALMTLKRGNLDEEAAVSRTGATFDLRLQQRRPRGGGQFRCPEAIDDDPDLLRRRHLRLGRAPWRRGRRGEINREIERLWLSDTHFENPVGFDARGHHMSARPSVGGGRGGGHPALRFARWSRQSTRASLPPSGRYRSSAPTPLFSHPPATGVKTVSTPAAGEIKVYLLSRCRG